MISAIEQLSWSLGHRPYVTLFMLFFLLLSWLEQGWQRTFIWVFISYSVALLAEWGSINHGIPFGYYVYHYDVLEKDLIILGVPFFDTISFSFLSYVSFSFSQFFMLPIFIDGYHIQRVDNRAVRNGWPCLLLGSVLMVVVDIIVDPIAHLGRFWFLGDIYHYPDPGVHYGVTLANYGGWFTVAFVTIFLNQRIDEILTRSQAKPLMLRPFFLKGLFAAFFWSGVVLFQLGVTYWVALTDQPGVDSERVLLQAVTGSYLILPILLLAFLQLFKPSNRWQKGLD